MNKTIPVLLMVAVPQLVVGNTLDIRHGENQGKEASGYEEGSLVLYSAALPTDKSPRELYRSLGESLKVKAKFQDKRNELEKVLPGKNRIEIVEVRIKELRCLNSLLGKILDYPEADVSLLVSELQEQWYIYLYCSQELTKNKEYPENVQQETIDLLNKQFADVRGEVDAVFNKLIEKECLNNQQLKELFKEMGKSDFMRQTLNLETKRKILTL